MPSPTFTDRRLFRLAAVLHGFQTVQGTPVADFTTAATRVMWAKLFDIDPGLVKDDFQGSTATPKKRQEGRFLKERKPVALLHGGATPKNLEWLLRSWGGTWSGGPTLTLAFTNTIGEFSTLAMVEKVPVPNTQKVMRLWDAWAHHVTLSMASGLSILEVNARFAARDFDRTPLNALGGITLPASYAPPAIDVFAPHGFRLYRDPASANVSVAVRELRIEFVGGLQHETWNDVSPQVVSEGWNAVKVSFRGVWMDETYAIETDVETLPIVFKRFKAEWTSGSKNFTIDMRNVDFTASPTGWRDGLFREFEVEGEAYLNSSDQYIDVTLTP